MLKYILPLSFVLASCKSPPPLTELCIVGDSGLLCIDKRLPEGQQEYVKPFAESVNYIATNPDDYDAIQNWILRRCRK